MPLFRKIAPIEARRYDPVNDLPGARAVMEWAGMRWAHEVGIATDDAWTAIIPTLEDGPQAQVKHYIPVGYWVAKNPGGEFYGIRPDVMADTYELVEEPATP